MRISRTLIAGAALALAFLTPAQAPAGNVIEGPVEAVVTRIVDGDTIKIMAKVWHEMSIHQSVRLAGIDTPELRARCDREAQLARAATVALEKLIADANGEVVLHDIRPGKYRGRVIARVVTAKGVDLTERLLKDGHGRPYDGGRRLSWCGEEL